MQVHVPFVELQKTASLQFPSFWHRGTIIQIIKAKQTPINVQSTFVVERERMRGGRLVATRVTKSKFSSFVLVGFGNYVEVGINFN